MEVKIREIAGLESALLGLSLSYDTPLEKMYSIALKLSDKDGGHNKFLESIAVWIDMTMPRYFWQQFDTYRIVVTKQSGSTMHTILREPLTQANFEGYIPQMILDALNGQIEAKNLDLVKKWLPESFLQRRVVCTNYKTLRNIILQRRDHKLVEWQTFCDAIENQLEHYELLGIK